MKKQLFLALVLLGGMSGLDGKPTLKKKMPTWIQQVKLGNKKVKAVVTVNPKYKTKKVYNGIVASPDLKNEFKNSSHICGPVCMKQKGFPYPLAWLPAGGLKWALSKDKNKVKNNGKPSGCVCANMPNNYMVVQYLDVTYHPSCFEMKQESGDSEAACKKMAQKKGATNQWTWEITTGGIPDKHGGKKMVESIYSTATLQCCMYFDLKKAVPSSSDTAKTSPETAKTPVKSAPSSNVPSTCGGGTARWLPVGGITKQNAAHYCPWQCGMSAEAWTGAAKKNNCCCEVQGQVGLN